MHVLAGQQLLSRLCEGTLRVCCLCGTLLWPMCCDSNASSLAVQQHTSLLTATRHDHQVLPASSVR